MSNQHEISQNIVHPLLGANSKAASWVEIDAQALAHNIAQYKKVIGSAKLAPVIKSNAYGHGLEVIAKLCDRDDNVDMICVVSLSEALGLRKAKIKKDILVLSIIDDSVEEAVIHNIDVIVYDMKQVLELNYYGARHEKKVSVHLKIDTGLSRLGIYEEQAIDMATRIAQLQHVTLRGAFTHLADSENTDQSYANEQISRFNAVIDQLASKGITIPLRHTACSAAITVNDRSHHTLVRVGIGTYGLWPSSENKAMTVQAYPSFFLRPVMQWKTRIIQIKEIPAGSFVGYDRTHQVTRHSRLATIPVGYWDGLDRRFSNNGMALINNQLAPFIGRIAMNLAMLDVTDIQAAEKDEVILLGNHPEITADALATRCNTISYEIVTRINPLLERRMV